MNTLILTKLGQIYRMELLAAASMMELNKNFYGMEINDNLIRFAGQHAINLEGLADMFSLMNYTPADDVVIPSAVEALMNKRDLPDRLLFSWLNDFETQLTEQYQKVCRYYDMNPKSLPLAVWKLLEEVKNRQDVVADEVATITSKTTAILSQSVYQTT